MTIPYWQQRRELKLKGPKPASVVREERKAKGAWYANQIKQAAKNCENCGTPLAGTKAVIASAIIAHILPKKQFPSVALHPLNRWFACGDCHTNHDQKGAKFVQSMPVFPILKLRVKEFYHLIEREERRRVPVYFKPEK